MKINMKIYRMIKKCQNKHIDSKCHRQLTGHKLCSYCLKSIERLSLITLFGE